MIISSREMKVFVQQSEHYIAYYNGNMWIPGSTFSLLCDQLELNGILRSRDLLFSLDFRLVLITGLHQQCKSE
jgi:hypothetical protein